MKIIHICDTHFNVKELNIWNSMMESLCNTIEDNCKDELFDIIVFSGDLLDKGNGGCETIEEGFVEFEKYVVRPLKDKFLISNAQIVFTPGNHDVDRGADSFVIESGMVKELTNRKTVDLFINDLEKNDYEGVRRMLPYNEFIEGFYTNSRQNLIQKNFFSEVHKFVNEDFCVGVVSFNTAWRCYDSNYDSGKLIIDDQEYLKAIKHTSKCDINIALMHHPIDDLVDYNRDFIRGRIAQDFDLFLYGHRHKLEISKKEYIGKKQIIMSCGTQLATSNIPTDSIKYSNGFSIINLKSDELEVKVEIIPYIYDYDENKFVINTLWYEADKSSFTLNKNIKNLQSKKYFNEESINKGIFLKDEQEPLKQEKSSNLSEVLEIDDLVIEYDVEQCTFFPFKEEIIRNFKIVDKDNLVISNFLDFDFLLLYVDKLLLKCNKQSEIKKLFNEILYSNDKVFSIKQMNKIFGWLNDFWTMPIFDQTFTVRQDFYTKLEALMDIGQGAVKELILKIKLLAQYLKDEENDEICAISEAHKKVYCLFLFIYSAHLVSNNNLFIEKKREEGSFHILGTQEELNLIINKIKNGEKEIFWISGKSGAGKTTFVNQIYNKLVNIEEMSITLFISCSIYKSTLDILKQLLNIINKYLVKKIKLNTDQFEKRINIEKIYEEIFLAIINALSHEFKKTYIIFDDIDTNNKRLLDIIVNVSSGSTLIFTSKQEAELSVPVNMYSLDNMNKKSISKFTEVKDEDINNIIFDAFEGNISEILKFSSNIKDKDIGEINMLLNKIKGKGEEKLCDYANVWFKNKKDYMEKILFLLSIFSSIRELTFDDIQKYLYSENIYVKKPVIKMDIDQVIDQIEIKGNQRICIRNKKYCVFIYNEYFSDLDFSKEVPGIFEWIYSEAEAGNIEIVANFLGKVKNIQFNDAAYVNKLYDELLQKIMSLKSLEYIFDIGYFLYCEFKEMQENALELIQVSGKQGYISAKEFLGFYYIDTGECINVEKSRENLINAIELGSDKAKFYYAINILLSYFCCENETMDSAMDMLWQLVNKCNNKKIYEKALLAYIEFTLRGTKSEWTVEDAIEELQNLANSNVTAKVQLANIYISGCNISRDLEKGIMLLEEARQAKNLHASLVLAKDYIYGKNMMPNIEKGYQILEELDKEGVYEASFEILQAHVRGYLEKYDIQKVCDMLDNYMEKGDTDAALLYVDFLIQNGRNIEKALEILNTLKGKGHREAAYELGNYYLENKRDLQRAIDNFKDAIYSGHVGAKVRLAQIYLDENLTYFAPEYGEHLLREAADLNDEFGQVKLAQYLLRKSQTSDAKEEAIGILEQLIKRGYTLAERVLGSFLLKNKINEANVERAENLLISAVYKGNRMAIWELAQCYMNGIGVSLNIVKAENVLRIGVERGDDFSKAYLGKNILEGRYSNIAIKEGEKLLLEAVANNEPYAQLFAGDLYIKGIGVNQNKKYGEALLRKAGEELDEALLDLALYKLDGLYLERDTVEGSELLEKASQYFENAKLELANRLIDGKGIIQDFKRGIQLILLLVNSKMDEAVIDYAERLINGEGISKNTNKGVKLLEHLIADGNKQAKSTYAHYLIIGKVSKMHDIEKDKQIAIKLLEENILECDESSMLQLASNLLNGNYLCRDKDRGESLLKKAIALNYRKSITYYGKLLIEGDILQRNKVAGTELLIKAISLGDIQAKFYYAKYCIEKYVLEDYEKGIKYMEELVLDGYEDAILYWATALLTGSNTKRNIEESKKLFDRLISLKNNYAIVQYSEYLINDQYLDQDIDQSEKVLQYAIENNYDYANCIRARRMLGGLTNKGKGKKKATNFFEQLYRKGNRMAAFEYGIRLKNGTLLRKNEQEAKKIIESLLKDADFNEKESFANIAYGLKEYKIASQLFEQCYQISDRSIINSIAYMVRRNEFTADKCKDFNIDVLLKPELEGNSYIAKVNYALYLVANKQDEMAWREGDKLIESLGGYSDDIDWWYRLFLDNDDEGRLVMAWLLRHGYLWDNSMYKVGELLCQINNPIWKIPEWMYASVN